MLSHTEPTEALLQALPLAIQLLSGDGIELMQQLVGSFLTPEKTKILNV